jgi:P-type Ca2+ transporter type 2C
MNRVISNLDIFTHFFSEDKRILVQHFKRLNKIMTATGNGTNDGPALKIANIRFSIGIGGTKIVKKILEIILIDNNFANIIKAIM